MSVLGKLSRSGWRAALAFVVVSLGPLLLLSISSMTLAERAVRSEVVARVGTSVDLSGSLVELEMQSVGELVEAHAARPELVRAIEMGDPDRFEQGVLDFQLQELLTSRSGMRGAFLADTSCTVWSVRPVAVKAIGDNFATRDWCSGVQATSAPYVSEAYRTAGLGRDLVVTAAAPIWDRGADGTGEPLGYLAVLYDLQEIERFVTNLESEQGVSLTIIDQRGTVLSNPSAADSAETVLYSHRLDPLLAEAFAGRSDATEALIDGELELIATSPIAGLGWVAMAEIPAQEAFSEVAELRGTVTWIAGVLALVLLAGAWFIVRALRLRQVAEAGMHAVESRTKGILDTASDAFVAIDENGRVSAWNAAATRLFGWSLEEALGRDLTQMIVPPEYQEAHTNGIQRFLRTGEGSVINLRREVEALDRGGRRFSVELAMTATQLDGSWTFNAFVHDISERKRHESELKVARDQALEASELKSEFLANMSHEIRTPMNGVIGMTSLLLETDLDPSQRDDAETVLRSGESLLAIINDILDFSKVEAGRLDLESIDFAIHDLIDDVTGMLSAGAAAKGIEMVVTVHPDVPRFVKGDPGRIRQILANLVGNAIKFTAIGQVVVEARLEAASLSTGVSSPEPSIRFDITDSGIGIGNEQQQTIFQTFTQADSSTTRRFGGTGLGLAISEQLVTLMQGKIGVVSTPGTGSTFWFSLPFTAIESDAANQERPDLRGSRVLVVGEKARTFMFGQVLHQWGVEYAESPGGRAALRSLSEAATRSAPFDVVLFDVGVRATDRFGLESAIESDPSIPPVALVPLTPSEPHDEAGLADVVGPAGHLSKPVDRIQLRARLALALSNDGPATPTTQQTATRQGVMVRTLHGGTILLAEDNLINQRVACRMLETLGYEVEVASNGLAAVAAAASRSFDAILMDCQMPEMDGFEATALIRAAEGTTRHTPIVAVTASAMEQDRQRCLDAGMDEHLAKPLRRDQLATMLDRFTRDIEPTSTGDEPTSIGNTEETADDENVGEESAVTDDLQTSIRTRLDELFEGLDGDLELERTELLQSFLRRSAGEIDQVTIALDLGDIELVRQRAHSLKGMAANVGVSTVAACAGDLEEAARDRDLSALGPARDELRLVIESAAAVIASMLPPLLAPA